MPKRFLCAAVLCLLAIAKFSSAQTLTRLAHQSPGGCILSFQLTDGTVMCQGDSDSNWYKLTPDDTGSYVNGTWSSLASLPKGYVPDAFASAVLADGRLIIEGGEYNSGAFALTNLGAIYDPAKNTWTSVAPPKGWNYIGDSPSIVLPNGNYLVGNKLTKSDAMLNPKTMTWTIMAGTGKNDFNAEEGWTLLANGTVLTADVKHAPNSEIFTLSAKSWKTAGSTIVDLHSPSPFGCINYGPGGSLCYYPPGEIGPAILRPDGTVFATGSYSSSSTGAGRTAIGAGNRGWGRRRGGLNLCAAFRAEIRFARRMAFGTRIGCHSSLPYDVLVMRAVLVERVSSAISSSLATALLSLTVPFSAS